jgi:hypothetical protein
MGNWWSFYKLLATFVKDKGLTMRYPRAFLVFDHQENLPDADHFKGLSNSNRAAYVAGISKPIKSIESQVHLVLSVNSYLSNEFKKPKDVVVLSFPKIFDFLMAYFGDKNLSLFWIDDHDSYERIFIANDALDELGCMDSFLYDASHAYFNAYKGFYHLARRDPHPHDTIINTMQAMVSGEIKTVLESELLVLLTQLLSVNVLNRIDL